MNMNYELRRSVRKTLSVEITGEGTILVRAPKTFPKAKIDAFLLEKQAWIEEKQRIQKNRIRKAEAVKKLSEAQGKLYREQARAAIEQKCSYYALLMGVTYNRIAIRDQKSRWGSCSSKGNLNFNWRLVMAPAGVLDYVVVHELAHRKEMNHSKAFWNIVEKTMPEYRKYKLWLKENGKILFQY